MNPEDKNILASIVLDNIPDRTLMGEAYHRVDRMIEYMRHFKHTAQYADLMNDIIIDINKFKDILNTQYGGTVWVRHLKNPYLADLPFIIELEKTGYYIEMEKIYDTKLNLLKQINEKINKAKSLYTPLDQSIIF